MQNKKTSRQKVKMIKIREYKEEDREKVIKMLIEVLTELFGENLMKEWEDFKKYDIFYVAEDNGRIVGSAALKNMGNKTGKLKRMYILQEYRNKGLGQKLLNKILEFCKENNFNRIVLSTEERLTAAFNFYTKNGFTEIKNINWEKDFADLKNEKVDITRMKFMEKKLK